MSARDGGGREARRGRRPAAMRPARRRLAVGSVLLLVATLIGWARGGAAVALADTAVVPLADLAWARDAEAADDVVREDVDGARRVVLPVDAAGVRWSTVFTTDGAATHRLALSWDPGPDGLLVEVLIDGERQPPPLDGWRPTRRHVLTDLGPRWLGDGEHLVEFVAREEVEEGAIVLRAMELRPAGG